VYARVYTRHYSMRSRKSKTRRPARRGKPFSLWLQPNEKETLARLSEKTGVDQTKLIRRGLALLFDTFNRGQLELGFPENVQTQPELSTRNVGL
jgi:Ribbon-helix-helix domain